MQSTNSEYGSPYLAVCHFHFFFSTKFKDIGFAAVDTIYSIMYKILKMHSDLLQLSKNIWMGSGRVIYVLGMGRFDTITILVCQYDMYCNGFFSKEFRFYKYCNSILLCVAIFVFNSRPWGKVE